MLRSLYEPCISAALEVRFSLIPIRNKVFTLSQTLFDDIAEFLKQSSEILKAKQMADAAENAWKCALKEVASF